MKTTLLSLAGVVLALTLSPAALALTVDQPVTPSYVRDHPKEFSVKVRKDEKGLIAFTVVRTLPEPRYLVAHLRIRDQGRLIAESHTPSFARKGDNTFRFSISPEHQADSTFELGESACQDGVPLPGTVNYQFQLKEFVPGSLPGSGTAK